MATFAFFFLVFHGVICLFHFGGFPYFHTSFYAFFTLLPLLASMLGFKERDRLKWPSIITGLASAGLLLHWIIMLILRIRGIAT